MSKKYDRAHWDKIKGPINARRRKKFQQEKEYIAHIIQNGIHKKIRLDRQKSKNCDICRREVKRRNAHHFSYENPPKDWITVCTACHATIHMRMGKQYAGIFSSIDEWYDAYKKAITNVEEAS